MENLSPELTKQINDILEKCRKRDAEVAAVLKLVEENTASHGKVQEGTKDAIATLNTKGAEMLATLAELQQDLAKVKAAPAAPSRILSVGEQFTGAIEKDADFAKFAERAKSTGWRGSYRFGTKTVTSIAASAGEGIYSDRLPGVIEEPLRPLSIRALLDRGTTSSNLIEWIRELLFTNAADVVSEGVLKPESNITYERSDVPVVTIAHWIRVTKQVLADFPMLQTLINGRMRLGLKIKEEDQILYGDGVAGNIRGLVPQATAYDTALNVAGDHMIDTIRHAILQVRLAFYPASGVVMSPTDWHNLELTKDNENRYLIASPTSRLPPMIWGQPVVESDAMARGNFLVGAFRMAATLFDREEASIVLSTEDQDNLVRNLVTILCEERLALAVTRPQAFVFGAFPAGSTT